jgi:hypothetical protein
MNKIFKRVSLSVIIISFLTINCDAMFFRTKASLVVLSKSADGFTENSNKLNGFGPGKVAKTKRKQEKNDKSLKRDYEKSVKDSQKRSYDIQTNEVKERMKQNKKYSESVNREKKKNVKSSTKSGRRKYN